MHRRSLPIANPCSVSFEAMKREGASRFCDHCQTRVTDLSAMTRVEASHFLAEHAGQKVCVRYRVEGDGTLRFRSPPPVRSMLAVAAGLLMAACTGHAEPGELASPDDAMTCVDPAGYTIPCIDAIPEPARVDDAPERADDGGEKGGVPDAMMGLVAVEPTDAGCPVPQPAIDEAWEMGEIEATHADAMPLMGEIAAPPVTRREQRKLARELRRERRHAR